MLDEAILLLPHASFIGLKDCVHPSVTFDLGISIDEPQNAFSFIQVFYLEARHIAEA